MYNPKSIPDIFKSIVANVSTAVGYTVHFKFGTRKVINDELKNSANDKYPLIALIDGWHETPEDSTIMVLDGLTLLIAVRSQPTDRAQERNDNNYIPRIFPIYQALCEVIGDSFFFTGYNTDFKHKVTDFPNMGLEDGSQLFEDCVDGRILEDISLRLNLNFDCSPNPYTPEGPIVLPPAAGWSTWGQIYGVLTDQTDLVTYINSLLSSPAWGEISGVITNQLDLVDYISSVIPEVVWGQISGDIKLQNDLIELIGETLVGYATEAFVTSQGYITSAALSGLVPYTGASSNLNLGTNSLISPSIIGGSAVDSCVVYKSTTGVGTTSAVAHKFLVGNNGATTAMTMLNSGLVGIGTILPTAALTVKGLSTLTGNALEVQNATPSTWFWVSNAGITYARGSANGSGGAGTVVDILQLQRASGSSVFSVNTHGGIVCGNTTLNPTSGAFYQYRMDMSFNPSSGSASFSGLYVAPAINQTGGSTGITIGIYIVPNITNAADFRGLEIGPVANQIRLQSGSTNPTVNGAITYLTTNQRLVINQNATVREFVTSDATTGATGAATGTIRVRINGTNYNLLFK